MTPLLLGDLFELKYGKALRKDRRNEGAVPVFGSNGQVDVHNVSLVNHPTIIVGRKGSIGEVHLVKTPSWPIDTTYFVEPLNLREVDLDWLYRVLRTLRLQELNRSAAIPGLNRDDVYRIPILLPPLDDQIRIAHLLGKAEGLIAQRKHHLKQFDQLTKSVFLEMFGDPVRNEKGWDRIPLEKLGSLNRGVSKHRPRNAPELLGGKYPLIQTGEVSNAGTYITSFSKTYSEIGYKQSKLWPSGTLCITIAANIAQTGILTFDACFPDSVVAFSPIENEAHVLYVHGLFWFFQKILEKNAPAAAQKNINLEILRRMEVPKPPIELQSKFALVVKKVEVTKSQYQKSLADLEELYGSLSQQAFKGELDLSLVTLPDIKPVEKATAVTEYLDTPIKHSLAINLPDTDDHVNALQDADARQALITQWLKAYHGQLGNSPFSIQHFMSAVETRMAELHADTDFELGANDYDHIKSWVFEMLSAGSLLQSRDITSHEENKNPVFGNTIEVKTVLA